MHSCCRQQVYLSAGSSLYALAGSSGVCQLVPDSPEAGKQMPSKMCCRPPAAAGRVRGLAVLAPQGLALVAEAGGVGSRRAGAVAVALHAVWGSGLRA